MQESRTAQRRALKSSMDVVTRIEAGGQPKIGPEELLSLCARFGLSKRTLARIREALLEEDWGEGPFLANYYANIPESCVRTFERVARQVFGARHALGVSSGTGALHSAFVAAGVGPGTEVICPAIGFFATANVVTLCGGKPVFCDVDDTLHMDPAKVEALITDRTVALAPTHVMGGVCDMAGIMKVARKHQLKVVEDCAQSCGGSFKGRYVGIIGDLGCFSISAYKTVGGGEGGLVLTRSRRLLERASQVAECGGLWRPDRFAPSRYPGELFVGTNYRMSELEAAVDLVQLQKLPRLVKRFRAINTRIRQRLKGFRGITPRRSNDPEGDVGYLLRFYAETVELTDRVVEAVREQGLEAHGRGTQGENDWHVYWNMFPLTEKYGYGRGLCPVADDLYDRVVTVPLNQWYTAAQCREFGDRINQALGSLCAPDPDAPPWI